MLTETVAGAFTVMTTALDVSGEPITQPALLVITHEMELLFVSVLELYVELDAPLITAPFFNHWYVGSVPPLTGVAVKVTFVPAQIAPAGFAAIFTAAAAALFTTIVMELDVAGEPEMQVPLLVSTQVITSLLARVLDEYVAFVAPVMVAPFFFHRYVGNVPPLVGVAVKVTLVPEHIAPVGLAAIFKDTGDGVLIVATTGVLALMHALFLISHL